ncbi:MAG: pilus assembly protein CpaE [Micromonosporaceae bacterium]|jgi:pilus assembly protein CpaE|nr:pilus assembly protein CpaE [Micromonosporaceae bacterium]MDT5035765.1 pilus assembly protein CpaE [Micromonosporaceae bacterium]
MTVYLEPTADRVATLAQALDPQAQPALSLDELAGLVNADRAEQLVVLGCGVTLSDAIAFAGRYRSHRPGLGVVLVRESVDVTVLAQAIRAGIREVIEAGDPEVIRAACRRSLEVSRQLGGGTATPAADDPAGRGRLISVFSGKGGAGKSTFATNLAVALAAGGSRRVLLVDLALSFGDIAIMLQLVPERSLVDAIPMSGRLDETGLRSLLTAYAPGVDTLLAPAGPADGERINRDLVSETLRVARRVFDFVVIDTPPVFSDPVLAALDMSDWYLLLATPDIPSLKNLRLTLDMFDLLEYPKEERIVVLNRSDSRVGLTLGDIERVVRSEIVGHVPSTRDVPVSINQGIPLMVANPNHPVSRAIRDIAENHLSVPIGASQAAVAGARGTRRRPFMPRRGR